MDIIKGNCPYCAKPLEIPADLAEFSCLYCGQRLHADELQQPASLDEAAYAQQFAFLRENLPGCVTNYPDYYKKFSKKLYFPAFEQYTSDNSEILERLDACIAVCPQGVEAAIAEICGMLLDAIDAHMQNDSRWKGKSGQSRVCFEYKFVLALFFTPLIGHLRLRERERFCKELHRQWMTRYPAQPWQPGDYEVISGGFRKRGFCFITTAVCEQEGKPDDCAELTAFRAFRDGWLRAHAQGAALTAQYYDLAPAIVACIDYCDDSPARYQAIREKWLTPCYDALRENRFEDCFTVYSDMMHCLTKHYLQ
ncbi:MAG: hypothetical protein LBM28_01550 [Oscillospiraceae bacterium]|jgi:hypothetical protein|nr:hypothetical protein [Oscillospiraceae bacterium]